MTDILIFLFGGWFGAYLGWFIIGQHAIGPYIKDNDWQWWPISMLVAAVYALLSDVATIMLMESMSKAL